MAKQYLVAPMKNWRVTQAEYGSFSHSNNAAIDVAGVDKSIEPATTSCYLKVVGKYAPAGSANSVFFVTCDENGTPSPVVCTDGSERIVTLQMTHQNDISNVTPGRIYKPWEEFYLEGTSGNATGNHIHLEVAEGIQSKYFWDQNKQATYMENQISNSTAFWLFEGHTNLLDDGGMEWSWITSDKLETQTEELEVYAEDSIPSGPIELKIFCRWYDSVLYESADLDSPFIGVFGTGTGNVLSLAEPNESGISWAKVLYNDLVGYIPMDWSNHTLFTK